jgi:hypothetical protein
MQHVCSQLPATRAMLGLDLLGLSRCLVFEDRSLVCVTSASTCVAPASFDAVL